MKDLKVFDFAENKNYKGVESCLLDGMDVNTRDSTRKHSTLLHIAARENDFELLRICKKFRADPNILDRKGQTPIYNALENISKDFVKELIAMGTDLNIKDNNSGSCFYWAVNCADLDCLKILYKAGADVDTENMMKRDPLIKACYMGKHDMVKWLLQFECFRKGINTGDTNNRTAMHAACWGPKGGRDGKK